MKKNIIKRILGFLLLLSMLSSYGQIDAFASEVQHKDGIILYNGEPFTGTLYSDDETDIPNACHCTMKAVYSKGKLHGEKQEWYANGKLKYKGKYNEGKPVGKHLYLFEDGSVKKEIQYASDGSYHAVAFNKQGEKIRETFYDAQADEKTVKEYHDNLPAMETVWKNKNILSKKEYKEGKISKKISYENSRMIITEYTADEMPLSRESYLKDSKTKDGQWIVYDEKGDILLKAEYENGILIQKQFYKDGKKDGKGMTYDPATGVTTLYNYKNGNLLSSKKIHRKSVNAYLNQHNKPGEARIVISYFDRLLNENQNYIVVFSNFDQNTEKQNKVIDYVLKQLTLRTKPIPNTDFEGKFYSGVIKIGPVSVSREVRTFTNYKKVGDKVVSFKDWGYKYFINFKITVLSPEDVKIKEFPFKSRTKVSLLSAAMVAGIYSKDDDVAFARALKHIHLDNVNKMLFPVVAAIKNIEKQTPTEIKVVKLDVGKNGNLRRGTRFEIYDQENKVFKYGLKVTKVGELDSKARIIKNGKWLKQYMDNHKEVFVREITDKKR